LIASFAAREVLVSTLSIIYNVGKDENEQSETLISAIRDAKDDNGKLVWTPLTALTLMVFFVLAMQCMSTVAIVRREQTPGRGHSSWLVT
jgi:ferrous iron transport protein B